MSFVNYDKTYPKITDCDAGRAEKGTRGKNAKVSGRKHELVDRCMLFMATAYIISDVNRVNLWRHTVI